MPEWSDYEGAVRLAAYILIFYLGVLWLTIGFWTYRDIRQRTRDPIVQAAAVLLVLAFFLPGHWVYLILRPRHTLVELYERSLEEEALLQELEDQKSCPSCKRRVREEYLICPSCRTSLKESCRSCAKPLSYAWTACPYCGTEKPPREHMGARPARIPTRPPEAPRQVDVPRPGAVPQAAQGPRIAESPRIAATATPSPGQFVKRTPKPEPKPANSNASAPAPKASRDPFARRMADETGPVIGE
jgi:RNA polymerase subunit RPABC4/transcription elongation factor Spt4